MTSGLERCRLKGLAFFSRPRMNGSVDPPLLSQDEFFRHLNLQSVHLFSEKGGGGGNGGKYMYRRALKERLRANTKTNYNQNRPYKTYKSKGRSLIHSPQVSPCKGLSDSQRRKIFGRPRVRVELKFEENENDSEEVKACIRKYNGLIKPLLGNCHVLRHPGIKRELEARTEAKQVNLSLLFVCICSSICCSKSLAGSTTYLCSAPCRISIYKILRIL